MKRVGILSDTHGTFDEPLTKFLSGLDEIWHAGDIGSTDVLNQIIQLAPIVRAVYGNIDGPDVRKETCKVLKFKCESVSVIITHIGGYPGKYEPEVKRLLETDSPNLLVCGHSHILKVINDNQFNLLHINPGAAGCSGFHSVRTAVRMVVDNNQMKNLEVWEKVR